ncbi:hypothetical protein ACJJTC_000281 [Scirpophaga incertulas]
MPSKKRKYNARFPAGRIKKIMQTDEEVGKVAQAVPIIISRTLELFVESLLGKAMQVTMSRHAKTLSPSHVKQCILAESRFDFLRDLVKNIPDVSAAEEKEMTSGESSPNSSRLTENQAPKRADSNSSSSCDRVQPSTARETLKKQLSVDPVPTPHRTETVTSPTSAIDLTKKIDERPVRTANFYQETLLTDDIAHRSVITVNPTYTSPQPSTSYTTMTPVEPIHKLIINMPKTDYSERIQNHTPRTPNTPILNIDFSKNIGKPEIKVLDSSITSLPNAQRDVNSVKVYRPNFNTDGKNLERKPIESKPQPISISQYSASNLQIDEDYDT